MTRKNVHSLDIMHALKEGITGAYETLNCLLCGSSEANRGN